jgi:hypothetical protein
METAHGAETRVGAHAASIVVGTVIGSGIFPFEDDDPGSGR